MDLIFIISIFIVIIGILCAVFRRTRPLILIVAIVWILSEGLKAYYGDDDSTRLIGAIIISLGLAYNLFANRKKYMNTLLDRNES